MSETNERSPSQLQFSLKQQILTFRSRNQESASYSSPETSVSSACWWDVWCPKTGQKDDLSCSIGGATAAWSFGRLWLGGHQRVSLHICTVNPAVSQSGCFSVTMCPVCRCRKCLNPSRIKGTHRAGCRRRAGVPSQRFLAFSVCCFWTC